MKPRRVTIGAVLMGCALLAAPAADAARPFRIATETGAHTPDVAVDGNGTAHVAWRQGTRALRYCAVPRPLTRCQPGTLRTLFTGSLTESVDPPRVMVTSDGIVVVYALTDRAGGLMWTSLDGFASATRLLKQHPSPGQPPQDVEGNDAALGPGAVLSLSTDGSTYESIPLGGMGPSRLAAPETALLTSFQKVGNQIATTGPIVLIVRYGPPRAGNAAILRTEYNTYAGGGSPHDEANWSAPLSFPGIAPVAAGGPQGLVVVYIGNGRGNPVFARKLDPATRVLGVARKLGSGGVRSFRSVMGDVSANPITGAFRAVYRDRRGLRIAASADGSRWRPSSLLVGRTAFAATRPRSTPVDVAAGPDGRGLAVWAGRSGVWGARSR